MTTPRARTGLETYNGRPMGATESDILKEMEEEFSSCKDYRFAQIVTSNYGNIVTDLETEWEFAMGPKESTVRACV